VSVGGISFDPLPAPSSFAYLFFGVWYHLGPSRVMPRYLVVSIICRIDAQVSHQYFLFSHTYCFGGRHVSTPDLAIQLAVWQPPLVFVTRKGQCQQILFSTAIQPYLDEYGSLLSDDDVAVTSVSRYMITKSVLIPKPVQMQPMLSQHLV
jgi:hypothetical protein